MVVQDYYRTSCVILPEGFYFKVGPAGGRGNFQKQLLMPKQTALKNENK